MTKIPCTVTIETSSSAENYSAEIEFEFDSGDSQYGVRPMIYGTTLIIVNVEKLHNQILLHKTMEARNE